MTMTLVPYLISGVVALDPDALAAAITRAGQPADLTAHAMRWLSHAGDGIARQSARLAIRNDYQTMLAWSPAEWRAFAVASIAAAQDDDEVLA
jgi:hypothetical protein